MDRRQNNGSVKAVSPHHCAATSALRTCSFNCRARRVTKTMSVALLLKNNPKRKKSNFRSPTPAVSTNHNLFEEKGEPKRYRTEVLPLTSLMPYRWGKLAHQ